MSMAPGSDVNTPSGLDWIEEENKTERKEDTTHVCV